MRRSASHLLSGMRRGRACVAAVDLGCRRAGAAVAAPNGVPLVRDGVADVDDSAYSDAVSAAPWKHRS